MLSVVYAKFFSVEFWIVCKLFRPIKGFVVLLYVSVISTLIDLLQLNFEILKNGFYHIEFDIELTGFENYSRRNMR